MSVMLEDKKAIVAEVAEVAKRASAAVLAEYRGLTAAEMTELRAKAREAGIFLRVVKNTLAARAVESTDFVCLREALVGPLVLAFSQEEPSSAARVIRDFSKEHEKMVVKALAMSGKLMPASQLNALATLPTKEEAISQLMALLKAPISKFVRTVAEPHAKLVRTMGALRDKKQAAA